MEETLAECNFATQWTTLYLTENGDDGSILVLPKSEHRFPFEFQLPNTNLPCSFESRVGTVRYYLRVIIDIPYASPPQGLKYFTVVGPHIDCQESRYTVSERVGYIDTFNKRLNWPRAPPKQGPSVIGQYFLGFCVRLSGVGRLRMVPAQIRSNLISAGTMHGSKCLTCPLCPITIA